MAQAQPLVEQGLSTLQLTKENNYLRIGNNGKTANIWYKHHFFSNTPGLIINNYHLSL